MINKRLGNIPTKERKELDAEIQEICSAIQAYRNKAGHTQESLAEDLDVNVNTIKYIEQGRRLPSLPMLIRICKKINLEIKIGKR